MSSYFKRILGFTSTPAPETIKQGLPASWYRSPELYELERRAIFSKSWLLVTHENRFQDPGDYLRFSEAGFSFFLSLDRKKELHGFHNVCRHRGFPLIHEDSGNMKILACKYHGWSYGVDGKLAKAPYFEDLSTFEKGKNDLLPIHVHTDKLGFIWVNLESAKVPSVSWEEQFPETDTHERFKPFHFSEYVFHHSWVQEADCNWKTLADNYNECLHCRTAHPDTRGLVDLNSYKVEGDEGTMRHFNNTEIDGSGNERIQIASTYYFPNACMTVSPDFFYYMRCVPTSATTCSMEYDVYRHKKASDDAFEHINQFFKRVLSEDKWLCNNTQANLNAGVYVNGGMHSQFESGPLYFQSLVKKTVMEHRMEEKRIGRDIWPAAQVVVDGEVGKEVAFCSGLACHSNEQTTLSW
ncbi:Rieske [2Fe-2S] domain protein [Pyrenochaeta sp. DS3sAY3a]|nr:Rieske [2Fe-2S] domain protein [Pyrenochaeta sp. DS3sAY3a]